MAPSSSSITRAPAPWQPAAGPLTIPGGEESGSQKKLLAGKKVAAGCPPPLLINCRLRLHWTLIKIVVGILRNRLLDGYQLPADWTPPPRGGVPSVFGKALTIWPTLSNTWWMAVLHMNAGAVGHGGPNPSGEVRGPDGLEKDGRKKGWQISDKTEMTMTESKHNFSWSYESTQEMRGWRACRRKCFNLMKKIGIYKIYLPQLHRPLGFQAAMVNWTRITTGATQNDHHKKILADSSSSTNRLKTKPFGKSFASIKKPVCGR